LLIPPDRPAGLASRSFDFLYGGAPQFTLGCSSQNAATGIWRFRIDFSPPGSVINRIPGAEAHHDNGIRNVMSRDGTVTLYGELGRPFANFTVKSTETGLETARLSGADVQKFIDASMIKVETPLLTFEAGTNSLGALKEIRAKLPCEPR
jgi:hypothetical protein